jgi:hypothetical protein
LSFTRHPGTNQPKVTKAAGSQNQQLPDQRCESGTRSGMPRFHSVVPAAGELRWETFLYELKAGPAGGLRPPSGPATTRRSPGCRPHRPSSRRRHRSLIDTSFSPGPGATSGPHMAGAPGTTAVNDGRSSSQVSRLIQETMLVGQPPRFSLARRKSTLKSIHRGPVRAQHRAHTLGLPEHGLR